MAKGRTKYWLQVPMTPKLLATIRKRAKANHRFAGREALHLIQKALDSEQDKAVESQ